MNEFRTKASDGLRRAELADFLRKRRAELTLEPTDFRNHRRRRTPGLRREEVAELAGVSISLYASLEQGRNIAVSSMAIDGIARALRLSEAEKAHAHRLVARGEHQPHLRDRVSCKLERFVMSCYEHPIFVLNLAWDIVLTNHAAIIVFGHDPNPSTRRNALESAYLDLGNRDLFVDWRRMARSSLETFRLNFGTLVGDENAVAIVERLTRESIEFAEDWNQHKVREHPRDIHTLRHPELGLLTVEPSAYAVLDSPELRLVAHTASDPPTSDAFIRLAAMAKDAALGAVPA